MDETPLMKLILSTKERPGALEDIRERIKNNPAELNRSDMYMTTPLMRASRICNTKVFDRMC